VIDILIGSLVLACNCSLCAACPALANGFHQPTSRSDHAALSPESSANILAWITKQAEKSATVTRTDINNDCREVCKFEGSCGWVNSFILRDSPRGEPHLRIPRVLLDEAICNMHETTQRCPADLVFNLAEVGISDWEDRQP
jgi:hypothetical protein